MENITCATYKEFDGCESDGKMARWKCDGDTNCLGFAWKKAPDTTEGKQDSRICTSLQMTVAESKWRTRMKTSKCNDYFTIFLFNIISMLFYNQTFL